MTRDDLIKLLPGHGDWLNRFPSEDLDYLVAAVGEGFCPLCRLRLTHRGMWDTVCADLDPIPIDRIEASGGCGPCYLYYRVGQGRLRPWFSVSGRDNMSVTLTLNDPAE